MGVDLASSSVPDVQGFGCSLSTTNAQAISGVRTGNGYLCFTRFTDDDTDSPSDCDAGEQSATSFSQSYECKRTPHCCSNSATID